MTINSSNWLKANGVSVSSDAGSETAGAEALPADLTGSLSLLMHGMLDAVVIIDAGGTIVEANQAVEEILGWRREDLIGRNLACLWDVGSGSRAPTIDALIGGASAENAWRGECEVRRRDGTDIAVEVTSYAIAGVPAEGAARIVSIRDISQRKATEEALAKSQHRLSEANRIGRIGHWEVDAASRKIRMFGALYAEFGAGSEESEASHDDMFNGLHEEDRELVRTAFERAVTEGGRFNVNYRALIPDGGICHVRAIGEAFYDENGAIAGLRGTIQDVDDQVQSEIALRESETRLRAAMEGSMDGVFFQKAVRDDDGKTVDFEFVDINPRGLELISYSREEIIGARLSETFPKSYREGLFDQMKGVVETGDPVDQEVQTDYPMETQWIRHQIVRYGDGVAFSARDISQRRQADAELRQTQARLQEAHRMARLGDWRFNLATQKITIYGSLGAALGLGKGPVEISLERAINAIHPKDMDRARDAFRQSVAQGRRFESTHRVRLSDKRTVFLHLIGEPIRDAKAKVTGMRGTIQDVTAEQESARALQRAKDKLSLAQRIAGIGSYEFEVAKNEITGSEEFLGIFGLEAERKGGISTEEYYAFVHQDDRDRLSAEISESVKSGENFSTEYRIITPEGTEKHVLGFAMPQFGDEGEFVGFTGTSQDVTASRQAEQQLRQAQKMEAVGQLTGGIAHDFNNLLAIITGNLDLARMQAQSDPRLVKMLEAGLSASERGAELTRQLLAYSRRQTLVPQPTDTNEVTSHVLRLGSRALGETVEVIFEPDDDVWWVHIDPPQLESALLNLAINARDAMPEGGTLTIRTRNLTVSERTEGAPNSLPSGDYVEIEVEDTGTGMSESVRQKVFEPFFTTKDVGQGSGLGLSMVYGFAQQSGGQVNIESTVGKGTSIHLYLPRAKGGTLDQAVPRTEAVESGSRDETVLIVEDDPHVRDLAISLVESLGYSVMQAGDPGTALAIFESGAHIDLLLSDVVLGNDMNGVEVANRVRENFPSVQILLMSGNAREALEKNGKKGDDYPLIDKPFRRAALAEKIHALLHQG